MTDRNRCVAATTARIDTLPRLTPIAEILADAASVEREDLHCGITLWRVDRPGLALPGVVQQRVIDAIIPVATYTLGADMAPYWRHRIGAGYFDRLSEIILIGTGDDAVLVGWSGNSLLTRLHYRNLYLDASVILPDLQGKRTMQALLSRAIDRARRSGGTTPLYLSARTESPMAYKLMKNLVGADSIYPRSGRTSPPPVSECLNDLADWLGQADQLDQQTHAIRNAFDMVDQLYGELPRCGDEEIDTLFRDNLGPLDAYLVIGAPPPP